MKAIEAQYKGIVLFVEDIEKSKEFYNKLFGLEILLDFGESVELEGGLMLWEKDFAMQFIYGEKKILRKAPVELYFETPDIEADHQIVKSEAIPLVHGLREEPWGQRTIRLLDPDGHIIEIAEPMELVALRLHRQGLTTEEVSEKTQLPTDFIEKVIEIGDLIYLKWEKRG